MAKKNEYLSRKERKKYSRLIAAKLNQLGVKDESIPQKLGTRKYVGPTGNVLFEGDVIKLVNPYRNLIRRLRSMPRAVVDKFLASPVGQPEGQTA